MVNSVVLVGRITKDIELKQTSGGISNCRFTIAVNRAYKDANGEKQADFINCVAWRTQADFLNNYCKKGNLISIVGSIQTGSYEKDGNKVFTTDVMVNSVSSLEKKEDSNNSNNVYANNHLYNNSNEVQNNNVTQQTFITEDDVPF